MDFEKELIDMIYNNNDDDEIEEDVVEDKHLNIITNIDSKDVKLASNNDGNENGTNNEEEDWRNVYTQKPTNKSKFKPKTSSKRSHNNNDNEDNDDKIHSTINIPKPRPNPSENQTEAAATDEPINTKQQSKTNSISKKENKEKNITLIKQTNDTTVEVYEAKITRPILSVYEYVDVHTKLAMFIDGHKSIKQFVDDVEINFTVNPAELAYHLLKEGKWDAVIDRGYEKVTYSRLKANPQWGEMIERYFEQQRNVYTHDLFEKLGLMD